MQNKFKIACFNVENLFSRARIFNFQDHTVGDAILDKVDKLNSLLMKDLYTELDKQQIIDIYTRELKDFISVRVDRGKLFKNRGWAVVGVEASGRGEWDGTIEFKQDKFSKATRGNTAKVLTEVNADVACIVEAENRPTFRSFDAHLLNSRYKYEILIDGNDPRGIDVGLYSKFPINGIWTHIYDKQGNKTIFSRDCLELEIILPTQTKMYILCNHFKSRGYDYDGLSDNKRKSQAKRVAQIINEKYDPKTDWVVIAGDLNDDPSSSTLKPLLELPDLYDVLELQFPNEPMKRWTYHYNSFEQIDYILISDPLRKRFREAGVDRRGIYKLEELTTKASGSVNVEKEFDTVTHWKNSASDHGAVWVEFSLP